MSIGLIGKKVGMTRVFNEDGSATAVTVIDVSDNVFLQKKTQEKDGYTAVQVGYGDQKESRINQAAQGAYQSTWRHAKAQSYRVFVSIAMSSFLSATIPALSFLKKTSGSTSLAHPRVKVSRVL